MVITGWELIEERELSTFSYRGWRDIDLRTSHSLLRILNTPSSINKDWEFRCAITTGVNGMYLYRLPIQTENKFLGPFAERVFN